MRPLEIFIVIFLAVYILYPITGLKQTLVMNILSILALAAFAAHVYFESLRWQMIPLYIYVVVVFILSFRAHPPGTPTGDQIRIILNLGLLALSTALPILLPVPAIPAPSGPYQVGTRIYELTDTSRKELYSGKDEARRFMIQVWYPSEADTSRIKAHWMTDAKVYAPALSEYLKLPSFFLNHLALVKIPAYQDAKVAATNEGYPVILFSHGWNGFDAQNTGQALELASNGFVVVGIQHTYGAVVTVFPDGTIAKNNPNALPSGDVPAKPYELAAQKLGNQWAGDLGYTLDFLTAQNQLPDSAFYQSIDLARVGVFGHSTGGGAAIQFCGTDPRCKALLGLDPFARPVSYDILDRGVTQPSFFMFSQLWADDTSSRNNELFNGFYTHNKEPMGAVWIKGTAHYDFTDLPLLSPLAPQLGLKGPINGKRVTIIVKDYVLHFFEATLKNGSRALFENPSPYPEIMKRN